MAFALIEHHRHWLWLLGALAGYALAVGASPVRLALLDGLRVLRRYRRMWIIPAGLGLCYALFRALLQAFFYNALPEDERPAFAWQFTWVLPPFPSQFREAHSMHDLLGALSQDPRWGLAEHGLLQGAEMLAGLFNCVVTTFPFSAVAAIMLLANWEDHHDALRQALKRRFEKRAWLAHAGIVTCALAAIVKPVLFGPSLIYLNRVAPGLLLLRWSAPIDWLSFLFEYLFGVFVQIYLILLAYAWLRGLNWTSAHLVDMAIRRFSFVVKWAVVVMGVSSLLIDLPRSAALMFRFDNIVFVNSVFAYIDKVARPLLALMLLAFATMQITLTFHSETLRKALADHFHFLARFWWQFFWFLLIAAIHLFALALLNVWLMAGFGPDTLGALLWSFIYPVLYGVAAAWLLGSWVSLFKRCETGRLQAPDWVRY